MRLAPTQSWKWDQLDARFSALLGYPPNTPDGAAYDAHFLYTLCRLESGGQDPEIIAEMLPKAADNHFGTIGWCDLNEYGDLTPFTYNVWGYAATPSGDVYFKTYGYYDLKTQTMVLGSRIT